MADTAIARSLRANLAALIDGMSTVDELAAKLSNMGCAGIMFGSCLCPIAVYLKRVGEYPWVAMGVTDVSVSDGTCEWADMEVPDLVRDFVAAYDRGLYPELIAEDLAQLGTAGDL